MAIPSCSLVLRLLLLICCGLRRMSFIIISDSAGVSFRDTDSFLSAGVDYNNISVHGAECDSGLQFGGHHTLARNALFLGTTCINPSSSTVDYRDSRHQHQTSQTWRLFCSAGHVLANSRHNIIRIKIQTSYSVFSSFYK